MSLKWRITQLVLSIGLVLCIIDGVFFDGNNEAMHGVVILAALFVFDKL